uniref:Uncharacterized protein n=1 Tax=Biomphalaria glabrata TaxID=6526 RepID=A0A2C9KYY7_BIOGL
MGPIKDSFNLDTKLVDLNKQRKLLEPRLNFTSEFRTALENSSEVKEIVEEYDEEKERLWDEQHRRNVRKYKAELKQSSTNKTIKENRAEGKPATDSELWSRLDELEMLEKEKGELNRSVKLSCIKDYTVVDVAKY